MDCCENTKHENQEKSMKWGSMNMDTKNVVLWVVIAILALAVIYVVFFKGGLTGNASAGALDTTGWTENEKMNYEMHGTIPARVSGASTGNAGGMVGGC